MGIWIVIALAFVFLIMFWRPGKNRPDTKNNKEVQK